MSDELVPAANTAASTLDGFRYDQVPQELGKELQTAASRIRALKRAGLEALAETGKLLSAAKRHLDHGLFTSWVEQELQITPRTALNYMRVHDAFEGKTEIVSVLPTAVVYRLAATSTPDEVRAQALEILKGRDPSAEHKVFQLIDANRPAAKKKTSRPPPARQSIDAINPTDGYPTTDEQEDERLSRETSEFLAAKLIHRELGASLEVLLECLRVAGYYGLVEAIEHCQFLERRQSAGGTANE